MQEGDERQNKVSFNYVEPTRGETGVNYDVHINDAYGSFVRLFHLFRSCKETDSINIYLNTGIFSDDAELLFGSMDICKALITVHVGFVNGFYGACVVAKADMRKYTDMSAISISTPKEYLTLRGLNDADRQIAYMSNVINNYANILINRGFCTKEEMDDIVQNNKQRLFKRDDLAHRLDNGNLVVPH